MVLSDFLSRILHDDSDPHEIISITFNMLEILKESYYNIYVQEIEKCIIETRSVTHASGVKLPEEHGREKG